MAHRVVVCVDVHVGGRMQNSMFYGSMLCIWLAVNCASANFTLSVVFTGQPCPMNAFTLSRSPLQAASKKAYCRPCTGDTTLL